MKVRAHRSRERLCLTVAFSPEDKDARVRHHFELVVLGGAGHLDGSQWDHAFRVGVLEQQNQNLRHLSGPGSMKIELLLTFSLPKYIRFLPSKLT